MSRKTILAFIAAALAIGTLASTSASAGFRPGHLPSSAGAVASVRLPHIPINRFSNIRLPHIPINRFSNIRLPHIPINRFSSIHLPHIPINRYQGGGYASYQGGGYAPAPVAYTPPARTYAAAPATTCLKKEYTQDGQVVFSDVCTNESVAGPIGSQVQAPQQP